jgi:hypothetical protein
VVDVMAFSARLQSEPLNDRRSALTATRSPGSVDGVHGRMTVGRAQTAHLDDTGSFLEVERLRRLFVRGHRARAQHLLAGAYPGAGEVLGVAEVRVTREFWSAGRRVTYVPDPCRRTTYPSWTRP